MVGELWMLLEPEPGSRHSKTVVAVKCDTCDSKFRRRFDGVVSSREKCGSDLCRRCSGQRRGNLRKGMARPPEIAAKARATRLANSKKVTIACKKCGVDFVVPYGHRDRLYCSRSCQSKAIIRSDIRSRSNCVICEKEFLHYGERIVCSRKCLADYMSVTRIGANNPMFRSERESRQCLACGDKFEWNRGGMRKGTTRVFCSLACSHRVDLRGRGLSGHKPEYPREFRKIREEIKRRDNRHCQLCGEPECEEGHHIHHIDYDKQNCDPDNLIELCQRCHNGTHHGRAFWQIIFSCLLSGSKIVRKPWGCEVHIANNNDYCLKYLVFFKGCQFSHHFHELKRELWHCVYGDLECVMEKDNQKYYEHFKCGDKIQIEPGVIHQLQARRNSILVEVSTRDYAEDSIRLLEGIN